MNSRKRHQRRRQREHTQAAPELSFNELRAAAKEQGINTHRMTKADLQAALAA